MITLLNGETYGTEEILGFMHSDDFYYGKLGTNALSSSMLKNIFDSPNKQLKYLKSADKPTDALIIGTLTHWAFLEPHKFDSKHYVEAERINAKNYKEAEEKYGAENVYKEKHRAIAEALTRKLHNNEEIREIRKNAEIEVPMIRMHDGYAIRGKADLLVDDTIYDLKTGIVSPEDHANWNIKQKHYDLQAYVYMRLFKNAKHFKHIYINKQTRDIGIIDLPDHVLDRGRMKFEMALEVYKKVFHNKTLDEVEYDLDQYVYRAEAK